MNFKQYKIEFEKIALNNGYSQQNIKRCLDYAITLFSNNVPVIYNTSHLAALVGYKKSYIKSAVLYTPYFYRDFEILKKNGKKRLISEPLPSLKEIQIWILENILHKIPISPYAKAYKTNCRIIENLRFHIGQPKVFTIDLENFFPSIKLDQIEIIFLKLGYSQLIANLLAKLCCRDECLPQGAPTSPCLSNIFFRDADNSIAKYCKERKINYTRYADDLSFSGDFNEEELLNYILDIIKQLRLKINNKKTKLMFQDARQTVTGILVNKKPQVVFHKRNELRQNIYYIQKFGLANHIQHNGIKQKNYLEHLLGKINFILQINPKDEEFIKYKDFLIKLKKDDINIK